jgi:hypothetical protein
MRLGQCWLCGILRSSDGYLCCRHGSCKASCCLLVIAVLQARLLCKHLIIPS